MQKKKFIIIGWCGGMGGGHIFTRNLCIVVSKLGWDPIVIHSSKKKTEIVELRRFDNNRIIEIGMPPSYYTAKERKKIINDIIQIIDPHNCEEFFVQSNGVRYSYWGELIAARLNCKHFVFLLENYYSLNDDYYDFYKFKLYRGELAAIKKNYLQQLFGQFLTVSENEDKFYKAFCTNSVEDIPYDSSVDFAQYDIVLGNIGRSSKPYVQHLGYELALFAETHRDKRILFLIVGGEQGTVEEAKIKKSLSNKSNIDIYSTGFLFPIPSKLLSHIDVSIASGGCIRISLEAGLITIAYKDNVYVPYGVCGYDLKPGPLPERPEIQYKLSSLLDDILYGDFCERHTFTPYITPANYKASWQLLEENVKEMLEPAEPAYYDSTKVFPRLFFRRLYVKTIGKIIPFHKVIKLLVKIM